MATTAKTRQDGFFSPSFWPLAAGLWVTGALAWPIFSQRFLFADGGPFFLLNAVARDVAHWDWPRQGAHYLTEGPLWLGFWAGSHNLSLLATLNGIGLFLLPWLLLWPVARLVPPRAQTLGWLVLASYLHVQINASIFIISEAHVAMSLAYTLFFYQWSAAEPGRQQLGWLDALVCALAVLAMRAYESAALFAPLQLWAACKALSAPTPLARGRRLTTLFVAVTNCVGGAIGLWAMLFNKGRTVGDARLSHIVSQLVSDPTTWATSLLLLAACLAGWRLPGASAGQNHHAPAGSRPEAKARASLGLAACFLLGCGLGMLPLSTWLALPTHLHYPARIFAMGWPPLIFGMALWRGEKMVGPPPVALLAAVLVLLGWFGTWQAAASLRFCAYRHALQHELLAAQANRPLSTTAIATTPFALEAGTWGLPSHSLIEWGLLGLVPRALVVPDKPPGYAPFDPNDRAKWPSLAAYLPAPAPAARGD